MFNSYLYLKFHLRIIRCDNAPILRLLGDTSCISTDNITLFLALLEKKVNIMLKAESGIDINHEVAQAASTIKKQGHEKVAKKAT